jgi:hypothetical protein
VTVVTDANCGTVEALAVELQGVAAVALNPTVAYDSRGSRRFRFLAPLLVTLGLAAASIIPSIVLG